jgi:hypothetical protein
LKTSKVVLSHVYFRTWNIPVICLKPALNSLRDVAFSLFTKPQMNFDLPELQKIAASLETLQRRDQRFPSDTRGSKRIRTDQKHHALKLLPQHRHVRDNRGYKRIRTDQKHHAWKLQQQHRPRHVRDNRGSPRQLERQTSSRLLEDQIAGTYSSAYRPPSCRAHGDLRQRVERNSYDDGFKVARADGAQLSYLLGMGYHYPTTDEGWAEEYRRGYADGKRSLQFDKIEIPKDPDLLDCFSLRAKRPKLTLEKTSSSEETPSCKPEQKERGWYSNSW